MASTVLSFNRAKVIQALLDSTIGELPEVRELQWDELMPFERAELDKQTDLTRATPGREPGRNG
jgi:hypothetical protein